MHALRSIGLVGILLTCLTCEPSYDPQAYFPLHTNDIHYYSGALYIVKVAGINYEGETAVWAVHYFDSTGTVYLAEDYLQDAQKGALWRSFALLGLPKIVFDPPIPMAPPALEVGKSDTLNGTETWADTLKVRIKRIRTVESIEDLVVTAGRFSDCVQVRFDHIYIDRPLAQIFGTTRFWFAEGVGIVKYEYVNQAAIGELVKATLAGKSFP